MKKVYEIQKFPFEKDYVLRIFPSVKECMQETGIPYSELQKAAKKDYKTEDGTFIRVGKL